MADGMKKPGRPKTATPKDRIVPIRLSTNLLRALDAARGPMSRSAFMRWLLQHHTEKGRSE